MVRYWLYLSMIFIVESCFILKINYTYECIKWIRSLLARIKYIEIRLWPAYYNTCAFCVNKLFIAYAVNCILDIFYHIRYTYMWKKYYIMQTNISIHYIRTNLCTHNKFISILYINVFHSTNYLYTTCSIIKHFIQHFVYTGERDNQKREQTWAKIRFTFSLWVQHLVVSCWPKKL